MARWRKRNVESRRTADGDVPSRRPLRRSAKARLIELPSGRTVEVVAAPPAHASERPGRDSKRSPRVRSARPGLCRACGSPLVYPIDWRSAPNGLWTVDLRCPNCERVDTVRLTQDEAERFDE